MHKFYSPHLPGLLLVVEGPKIGLGAGTVFVADVTWRDLVPRNKVAVCEAVSHQRFA